MSHLWAAKAAHKNNTAGNLIPGSARFISNELSVQFSAILDADEDKNSLFVQRYSELNTFMEEVKNGRMDTTAWLKHEEEHEEKEYLVGEESGRVIPELSFNMSQNELEVVPPAAPPSVESEHNVIDSIIPDTSFVIHDPIAVAAPASAVAVASSPRRIIEKIMSGSDSPSVPVQKDMSSPTSPQRLYKRDPPQLTFHSDDINRKAKLLSPPKLKFPDMAPDPKLEIKKNIKTLKKPIIEPKGIDSKPKQKMVVSATLPPVSNNTRLTRPKSEAYYDNRKNKRANSSTTPKTPLRITAETLPHVLTDDEDDPSPDRDKKVLQDWARSPELRESIIQNKTINASAVFGKEPKLDLFQVFENRISSERGGQSPERTPDIAERKREEREYIKKMGYL
ncbi:hypothetical protein JA1_002708 [Spathaspora sp. JA1]|nr:hypothetical protein JA1_002708 [Spathaspora sp. JA1]